ncbi:hypothetical protein Tco_0689641 [Tanacetum coccineum]
MNEKSVWTVLGIQWTMMYAGARETVGGQVSNMMATDTDEEIDEQELKAHTAICKIQEVPIATQGNASEAIDQYKYDTGYKLLLIKTTF